MVLPHAHHRSDRREAGQRQRFEIPFRRQPTVTAAHGAAARQLLGALGELPDIGEHFVLPAVAVENREQDALGLAVFDDEQRPGQRREAETTGAERHADAAVLRAQMDEAAFAHGEADEIECRVGIADAARQVPRAVLPWPPFVVDQDAVGAAHFVLSPTR